MSGMFIISFVAKESFKKDGSLSTCQLVLETFSRKSLFKVVFLSAKYAVQKTDDDVV